MKLSKGDIAKARELEIEKIRIQEFLDERANLTAAEYDEALMYELDLAEFAIEKADDERCDMYEI